MNTHQVLIENADGETTGELIASSIDYQSPEDFIGEIVNVHTNDENGNPVEISGKLIEIL